MGTMIGTWRKTVAVGAMMLVPQLLIAQGTVSGQLALLEKPGAASADLATAVIYLVPVTPPEEKLKATRSSITMSDREFTPHVVVMTPGSTIRFVNQDPFEHNAFSNSPSGNFDFGLSDRGATVQKKLPKAGVYPVFCNIHARMAAFVLVVPTEFFTLAGSDGRFTINEVPAGEYTLIAWHQRGGQLTQQLKVGRSGTPNLALQLDARGFRPKDHKNKYGKDYKSDTGERY
jgi:plastocyanin